MGTTIQQTTPTTIPETTAIPELKLGDEANLKDLSPNDKSMMIGRNGRFYDKDNSGGLSAEEINNEVKNKLLLTDPNVAEDVVMAAQSHIFKTASNDCTDPNSAAVFYGLDDDLKYKMLTDRNIPTQFKNNLAQFDIKKFVGVLEAGFVDAVDAVDVKKEEVILLHYSRVTQTVNNLEEGLPQGGIEEQVLNEIRKSPILKSLFEVEAEVEIEE